MADIVKYNPQELGVILHENKNVSGLELRRMILTTDALNELPEIEKSIFAASAKMPIAEIPEAELIGMAKQMFRYIAIDVGYNIPANAQDWMYQQTRILTIIRKYFGKLSLSDVKLAFELAVTGELDDYLPKDGTGNADRKHYQQFNAEYFSKILNAYQMRRKAVIGKVYDALPEPKKTLPQAEIEKLMRRRMEINKRIFLDYKATGKIEVDAISELLCYEWLVSAGLAKEVEAGNEDRKQALQMYLRKAEKGLISKYMASFVAKQGTDSREIDYYAVKLARKKEIIKAFDRMIAEDIQVDDYLTIKTE